ncbi:MAG TPA: hypothetical protein VHA37_01560, partial [Candidatus Saccharimonadales bacterium]|nr:hypothetical protein [Candidatus Saccharimonadales bacterium]
SISVVTMDSATEADAKFEEVHTTDEDDEEFVVVSGTQNKDNKQQTIALIADDAATTVCDDKDGVVDGKDDKKKPVTDGGGVNNGGAQVGMRLLQERYFATAATTKVTQQCEARLPLHGYSFLFSMPHALTHPLARLVVGGAHGPEPGLFAQRPPGTEWWKTEAESSKTLSTRTTSKTRAPPPNSMPVLNREERALLLNDAAERKWLFQDVLAKGVGARFDALDEEGCWYPVTVLQVDADRAAVLVNWEGWPSEKHDSWIRLIDFSTSSSSSPPPTLTLTCSPKIAHLGAHSRPYQRLELQYEGIDVMPHGLPHGVLPLMQWPRLPVGLASRMRAHPQRPWPQKLEDGRRCCNNCLYSAVVHLLCSYKDKDKHETALTQDQLKEQDKQWYRAVKRLRLATAMQRPLYDHNDDADDDDQATARLLDTTEASRLADVDLLARACDTEIALVTKVTKGTSAIGVGRLYVTKHRAPRRIYLLLDDHHFTPLEVVGVRLDLGKDKDDADKFTTVAALDGFVQRVFASDDQDAEEAAIRLVL